MATKCPVKNLDGTVNLDYSITDDYLLNDHSYGVNYKKERVKKFNNYKEAEEFCIALYCGNNPSKCKINNK